MRRGIVYVLAFVLFAVSAHAVTMQDLFNGLRKQPQTVKDKFAEKSAKAAMNKATSMFYPKLYGFASYEHFNVPTSLRPVTPTESAELTRLGGSFPFSKDISQVGVRMSVPVFVYPLFSLAKKAQQMVSSAKEKKRLNLIRNEATVVTLNARLAYTEKLINAIKARKASLESEYRMVKRGVEVGRMPGIQLLKIKNAIDLLQIKLNQVKSLREKLIWSIYSLTGIKLRHSVKMHQLGDVKMGDDYLPAKPLGYALKASKYDIDAQKGKLYPSLYLKGFVTRKFGTAYNTNDSVIRNYGSIGIYLQIPIFDKTIYADVQKARSNYMKNRYRLKELIVQLRSDSKSTLADLKTLKHSILMARKSLNNYRKLLKYAKVAFENKRMTEEEYLRYESDLLNAQATLYELESRRWDDISRLAVIYGNNLKEIVK